MWTHLQCFKAQTKNCPSKQGKKCLVVHLIIIKKSSILMDECTKQHSHSFIHEEVMHFVTTLALGS